jgi:hypothetical protein
VRQRKPVARELPEGVEHTTAKGRDYFYWNPHRGTERQGKRIPLPNALIEPEAFWREITKYAVPDKPVPIAGTVAYLVSRYRDSEDFKSLSESTRASYGIHLNRIDMAWGPLSCDLPDGVVIALRDGMASTPGMANHMLSLGRSLWTWGRSIGVKTDPFTGIADLPVPDRGHVPWPDWAVEIVCKEAWPDLVRMVRLGLATCQRESDLIRMGPAQRDEFGLWCRPKKTRRKRKAFCIPLSKADALMLDRWPEIAIAFTASRWKVPVKRSNRDFYLFSPRGVPYTETSLRARWQRWLKTVHGKELCRRWQAWVAEMVKKYEWEIDPAESLYPTIHGLRGTGILIRRSVGHDVDQIANDIGMSRQMVERYMRFRDQMKVAMSGYARLHLIGG